MHSAVAEDNNECGNEEGMTRRHRIVAILLHSRLYTEVRAAHKFHGAQTRNVSTQQAPQTPLVKLCTSPCLTRGIGTMLREGWVRTGGLRLAGCEAFLSAGEGFPTPMSSFGECRQHRRGHRYLLRPKPQPATWPPAVHSPCLSHRTRLRKRGSQEEHGREDRGEETDCRFPLIRLQNLGKSRTDLNGGRHPIAWRQVGKQ